MRKPQTITDFSRQNRTDRKNESENLEFRRVNRSRRKSNQLKDKEKN